MSDGGKAKPHPVPAPAESSESNSTELRQELETDLKTLPAEKREVVIQRVLTRVEMETYRGALPHPRHFAQFDQILPGAAERLLTMAEREQGHNHDMGRMIVRAESGYAMRGQVIASLIVAVLIGCAMYSEAALHDTIAAGSFLGVGTLSGVAAFLRGQIGWDRKGGGLEDEEEEPPHPKKKEKPKRKGR